ncbi:MAG: recombination protein RecR [Deltaproteobacteria bacterium]|nr:recombination protein RecR [Deltaproteobacteria bacterium]
MNHYPASILNVIKHLSRLPGIGEKTAERLTMHILKASRSDAEQLARSIIGLKDKVQLCSSCFGLSDGELCSICRNPARNATLVCVVEQPADMVAIEKSGAFQGLYHILGGCLAPMDGVGPADIRIRELLTRISSGCIKEVVLATNTNVEGEATADYIFQRLKNQPVKITRIASGVPIGGDLKFVDQVTLKRAMETRHAV